MSSEAEVLAANRAFYEAFTKRDVDAMAALWAARAPVACIHPGWGALVGRDEVLSSWRAILGNPRSPKIRFSEATAHVHGELAFVLCAESVGGSDLIATNLFVREDGAWRMVHHHAGPVASARERGGSGGEKPPPPEMLN